MHGWYFHGFGISMLIFVWIAMAFLFAWLLIKSIEQKELKMDRPIDILKRRYANGEISTDEFEERKKTLNKYSQER